jgi:hypothetical protein
MAASSNVKVRTAGQAKSTPKADLGTSIAIAKAIYDAGKSGIEFTQKLHELSKGNAALGVVVVESFGTDDRLYLVLKIHNYSPHAAVVERFKPSFPEKSPLAAYLLVPKKERFGYTDGAEEPFPDPNVGLWTTPLLSPVRIPPDKAQEFLLSWDRKDVLNRIHAQRRGRVLIEHSLLGSSADAKDDPVDFRFREDCPALASHTR